MPNKVMKAIENSIESQSNLGEYTLNGRVYNSERYSGPLAPRKTKINIGMHNEKVSATDVYNMERFLAGCKIRVYSKDVSKEDKERVIQDYNLHYSEEQHRWMGSEEDIYNKLCERYPQATTYKKYKGILYAMKYGDTRCNRYNINDREV